MGDSHTQTDQTQSSGKPGYGPRLRRLSVFCVVGLIAFKYIDFRAVWESTSSVSLGWVILIIVMISVDRVLMSIKWILLMRAVGVFSALLPVLDAYYQATFVQRFIPSTLGGDALRGLLLTKKYGKGSAILASMVVEKLVGLCAALSLALLALIFAQHYGLKLFANQYVVYACVIFVVVNLVILYKVSFSTAIVGKILGWFPEKIASAAASAHKKYSLFSTKRNVLVKNFVLASIEQGFQVAILLACALAISVQVSIGTLVVAIAISQALRKFAILLEGWLLGEFTNVMVCVAFGIPQSEALAFSLLGHACGLIACAPGGVFFVRAAGDVNWSSFGK